MSDLSIWYTKEVNTETGRQVSYFFLFSGQIPIFPIFERNSYFFLFFSKLGSQNVFFSTLS